MRPTAVQVRAGRALEFGHLTGFWRGEGKGLTHASPGCDQKRVLPEFLELGTRMSPEPAGWKACATRSADILVCGFGRLSSRPSLTHVPMRADHCGSVTSTTRKPRM